MITSEEHRARVIRALAECWDSAPALRLCQLIECVKPAYANNFHLKDEVLVAGIEKFRSQQQETT